MNSSPQGSSTKSLKIEPNTSSVHPSQLASHDSLDGKNYRNTPHSESSRYRFDQTDKKKRLSKAFPAISQKRAEGHFDGETFYKLVDQEEDVEDRAKNYPPFEMILPLESSPEKIKPSQIEASRLDMNQGSFVDQTVKTPQTSNRGAKADLQLFAKKEDKEEPIPSNGRKLNAVIPLIKQQSDKSLREPPAQTTTDAQRRWDLVRNHCDSIRASWQ